MIMMGKSIRQIWINSQFMSLQVFDNVTIMFSYMVGFAEICSQASAMKIVECINNVFTMFDNIIDQYDVFKVTNYTIFIWTQLFKNFVSLALSLSTQFVNYVDFNSKYAVIFGEKMRESAKDSHIFSTKNNSVFVIFTFEILTNR